MKRHLLTLALGALVGSIVLVGDAQACHKKKAACAPAPVVCAPAPVCEPAPVACAAPAKKHCFAFKNPLKGLGHHKKAACAPAPAPCNEVVVYSAPVVAPSAQIFAAPQASGQH